MSIAETKQISEQAYRIVSSLANLPVQRQLEIILIAQALINMEMQHTQQQMQLLQQPQPYAFNPAPDEEKDTVQ